MFPSSLVSTEYAQLTSQNGSTTFLYVYQHFFMDQRIDKWTLFAS